MQHQPKDSSSVCKHLPLIKEDESFKKHSTDESLIRSLHRHYGKSQSFQYHPNCKNVSQNNAVSCLISKQSHFRHISGYQTDDSRTLEGEVLHLATKTRPANICMTAVKDYNPWYNDEEVVLRLGQRVKVLYKNKDRVYVTTKTGEAGYVPYNYVRPSCKLSYDPGCGHFSTHFVSGYTSASEYPTTSEARRHPRPAKSLHSIVDANGFSATQRRPTSRRPELCSD